MCHFSKIRSTKIGSPKIVANAIANIFYEFLGEKVHDYVVYKSGIDYRRIKNKEKEKRVASKANASTTDIYYKKILKNLKEKERN